MSSNIYSISDSSISIGPQTTYFNLHIHTSKHFYLWSFNPYIYIRQKSKHMRIFQSLHLPKMWYGEHYRLSIVEQFQSTHSYKMRRIGKLVEIMFHAISIHASVRNATSPLNIKLTINRISIHASVQNATSAHQDRYSSRADFNPRIRVECNGNNINDFRIPVYNV